jgi:hypothetical protein
MRRAGCHGAAKASKSRTCAGIARYRAVCDAAAATRGLAGDTVTNSSDDDNDGWPRSLYKYRPLRSDEDLARVKRILDGWIYASPRSAFNDPFDCAPVIKAVGTKSDFVRHALQLRDKYFAGDREAFKRAKAAIRAEGPQVWAERAINTSLDGTAIISLTTIPNDLLMWGHYGSEHTGVCIGFSLERPNTAFRHSLPVSYSDIRPELTYPIQDAEELLVAAFLTKASCWSYESEWRIAKRDGPGEMDFSPNLVRQVIFGARSTDASVRAISEHIAVSAPLAEVVLSRAKLDDTTYRMDIEDL